VGGSKAGFVVKTATDIASALPPVHVKTLRVQPRIPLVHRKVLQSKAIAIENDLRCHSRARPQVPPACHRAGRDLAPSCCRCPEHLSLVSV